MKDSCQAMRQAIFGLFVLIKNVSQSELPPQIVPIRKESYLVFKGFMSEMCWQAQNVSCIILILQL